MSKLNLAAAILLWSAFMAAGLRAETAGQNADGAAFIGYWEMLPEDRPEKIKGLAKLEISAADDENEYQINLYTFRIYFEAAYDDEIYAKICARINHPPDPHRDYQLYSRYHSGKARLKAGRLTIEEGWFLPAGAYFTHDPQTGRLLYDQQGEIPLNFKRLSPEAQADWEACLPAFKEFWKMEDVIAILHQIALAEVAIDASPDMGGHYRSDDAAGLKDLASSGFRPDPNVVFAIALNPASQRYGFIAAAAWAKPGSPVYFYGTDRAELYDADTDPAVAAKISGLTLRAYSYKNDTGSIEPAGPALTIAPPAGKGLEGAARTK